MYRARVPMVRSTFAGWTLVRFYTLFVYVRGVVRGVGSGGRARVMKFLGRPNRVHNGCCSMVQCSCCVPLLRCRFTFALCLGCTSESLTCLSFLRVSFVLDW